MTESECPICLENTIDTLECGHKIHIECVKKHFKPECPVCKKTLSIKVNGKFENDSDDLSTDAIRHILEQDENELSRDFILQSLYYEIMYALNYDFI
jgi:hypothetical protein